MLAASLEPRAEASTINRMSKVSQGDLVAAQSIALEMYTDPLKFSIQSSPVTSLQAQMLSFFIEDFGCLKMAPHHLRPWALDLPFQVHPPELEKHFHHAASGAAMAFYGMITVDRAMKEEARRIYASSLDSHRKLLLRFPKAVSKMSEAGRTQYLRSLIAITLLLSSFELLLPASLNSWFSHCEGAAYLLKEVGPQACEDGFMHQVFQVIRFGSVSHTNVIQTLNYLLTFT